MMINNMDHTLSSSTSLTNCRQTASYADKSESAKYIRRRRTELRRLKVMSNGKSVNMNGDDCVTKRRRFGKEDGSEVGDGDLRKETASPEFFVTAPSVVRESEAPVVEEYFPYHLMSVIGRRREMEDAVAVELGFVDENSRKYDFYGVYDGHGGSQVAHACRDRLHKVLVSEMEVENQKTEETNWEDLMVETFTKMDDEVTETDVVGSIGSTAVVAVVGDGEVVVANCGDSRAVLSRGGVTIPLSNDHKPDRQDELARIENSGGRVINWNGHRVLGVLATSRAIGDKQLKPFVIAKPEVTVNKRDAMDEFLILGSDGLWDVISNDLACHVVRKCFDGRISRRGSRNMNGTIGEARGTHTDAAAVLTELAIARGSKDNISVIVVNLRKR